MSQTPSLNASEAEPTARRSVIQPRHEQAFLTLTAAEIERVRRFGEVHQYQDGDVMFETEKAGPGMFVVLCSGLGQGRTAPVMTTFGHRSPSFASVPSSWKSYGVVGSHRPENEATDRILAPYQPNAGAATSRYGSTAAHRGDAISPLVWPHPTIERH